MSVLTPGTQVSRYRIVSRIGAGGMGEVYKAHDPSLDRSVALKILPQRLVSSGDRLRRFEHEAKAASGLSHPHIVAIHEVGVAGNGGETPIHYIAMELVEGRTLRDAIGAGLPLRDALEALSHVADALAKAHAAGIVHRDLKPENIMITPDGYGKVLDFGLAKLVEAEPENVVGLSTTVEKNTTEGVVLGTPGYMSPEQVRGLKIDHRSDIFSFGCILYEAVTRRRPFQGDSKFDVLQQIVSEDPQPLADLAPNTPGELRRMIRRCMNKDPERRYQSMKDVAMELRDIVQEFDSITTARPFEPPPPAVRRRVWAAAALAAAVVLAAAWIALRRPAAPQAGTVFGEAKLSQLTRSSGVESFPRLSPDGNFLVYVSAADGDEDIYLQRLGGFNAINLTERSSANDSQPAFSPDGRFIAFHSTRDGGGIYVMGATGESVRRLTGSCANPAWSPDSTKIVCASVTIRYNPLSKSGASNLFVVDVATGEKKKLGEFDGVQPAWSPGGHRIAFWSNRGMGSQRDIFTVSSTGGDPTPLLDDAAADWAPAWAPDGRHLYFSSDRGGTMGLWRIAIDERSGAALGAPEPLPNASRWNGPLDVSADGRKIVFSSAEVRAEIYRQPIDPGTGTPAGPSVPVFHGITRAVDCSVSPDGQWLAFRSEGEQEDVFVVRTDGTELRQLTNDIYRDRGVAWSPDGRQLAFYSDRAAHQHDIWTIAADGSQLQRVTRSEVSIWFPRWSPDGRFISVNNQAGSYLIDLNAPKPITKLDPLPSLAPGRVFRAMAWSPDGLWIAGRLTNEHGAPIPGTYLYSVAEKRYEQIGDSTVTTVGWLPDNRRIVVTDSAAGKIRIVDRTTRQVNDVGDVSASEWSFGGLTVTADGREVYFVRTAVEADIWMLALP